MCIAREPPGDSKEAVKGLLRSETIRPEALTYRYVKISSQSIHCGERGDVVVPLTPLAPAAG
jgi:hypothetical protein